jgi:hypothetical protein
VTQNFGQCTVRQDPRAKDPEPHTPSHTPRSMEIVIMEGASTVTRRGSWALDLRAWALGDIYNGFKLFFGVSSAGSSGIKTLFISSAHLKEIWRVQILTSGTHVTILGKPSFIVLADEIHNKIYRSMMSGRTTLKFFFKIIPTLYFLFSDLIVKYIEIWTKVFICVSETFGIIEY